MVRVNRINVATTKNDMDIAFFILRSDAKIKIFIVSAFIRREIIKIKKRTLVSNVLLSP